MLHCEGIKHLVVLLLLFLDVVCMFLNQKKDIPRIRSGSLNEFIYLKNEVI